ncbi:hypothetical protein [Methanogenium cariaci]|uniref:hypothetical protein n=1 Tax=Methanogenium cariaci TaxID=2197 RepID=UPI0007850262|nr:hypothetical protein [Methanogenium cariaci]
MEPADLIRDLVFLKAEKDLAARFGLSPPRPSSHSSSPYGLGGRLELRIRESQAVSVMKKTSVYDEETKLGSSLEEVYLLVNPAIKEGEGGTVHRLEKCGNKPARLLVERPFRVKVRADRILKMTIDPLAGEIRSRIRAKRRSPSRVPPRHMASPTKSNTWRRKKSRERI